MGTAQSTRKITLVNDDKAGVIKLSESLAYRLRGQIEGQQTAAEVPGPAAAAEPPRAPVAPAPEPPPLITPIPQIPETPKVTYLAPVPETVAPTPIDSEPVAPEPIAQKPLIPESSILESAAPEPVVSEPAAPESLVPEPAATAPAVAEATSEATVPPSAEIITVSPSLSLPIEVNEVPRKEPPETASPPAPATVSPPDLEVAIKAGPPPTLSQPAGNIPPWSIYAEEAHLMVMRLREEKEQEIQKLNLNWRDKMDAREKEFTKMAHLSEEEATAALKDVEKLFLKASCSPICQNHQEAVMNCYQDHPRQSLRCAKEVENFTQCVDLSRLQSVIKQRAN